MSDVAAAELVALPGTTLICPNCGETVGVLTKPLYQGYSFGLDAIRFAPRMAPDRDKPEAACRACSTAYAIHDVHLVGEGFERKQTVTLLIHTDRGWLPRRPPDEQLEPILSPWP